MKDDDLLLTALSEHRCAIDQVAAMAAELRRAAALLREVFAAERRLFICGNGGSATDAQHFAAELTGRFEKERRGYPAQVLSADAAALTSIGNDYGFEQVFARQLEAQARRGDALVVISTSGNSPNVVKAVEQAHRMGVNTVGLLGRDGGACAKRVDIPLVVGVPRTARIQEAHILMLHVLCEALDD